MSNFVSWEKMRDEVHKGNIEAAREAYHAQDAKKAIAEAAKAGDRDLVWLELDEFAVPHEVYVQRQADRATVLFGALKDGQWVERGEMGWFGCVSGEKDQDSWNRDFNAMLDALPDDTWLTVVDCHI